jgi:hypothetical protein
MTLYRLDELAKLAAELGLDVQRVDAASLDVHLRSDIVLIFWNLLDENDTLVGFEGTPWHSHGTVQFCTGANRYIECDELEILVGLGSGELLVVSQYRNAELVDRWIVHKNEPLDVASIEAGEELRVYRLRA